MVLIELVRVRLLGNSSDLGSLIDFLHRPVVMLLCPDLVFNVLLLADQRLLAHDLLVKNGRLLLKARLQEALSHLLDDIVDSVVLQAGELDPLAEEAGSDLDTALQVQPVVLGAAED